MSTIIVSLRIVRARLEAAIMRHTSADRAPCAGADPFDLNPESLLLLLIVFRIDALHSIKGLHRTFPA